MSAPPRVVLLDSCAYFRLARSIHPLLSQPFGPPPPFSLFVLKKLDDEYARSARLRTKFEWVNEKRFRDDREAKRYEIKGKKAQAVATAFSFLDNYSREQSFALAKVDLWVLAVGFVRTIPVVSDDRTLCEVGQIHGIECWSTLHLLTLMVEHCRISVEDANSTLEYLQHENDLPMGIQALRQRYLALFGQPCRL